MGYPVQHKLVPSLPVRVDTHLQAFFNQSPDLFCIIEPDGTFGQLNLAWQRLLDWTPAALRSRLWIELVHPEDIESTLRVLATRKVPAEPFYFKNRYRHQDGSYRWLSWSWYHGQDGWDYAAAREVSADQKADQKAIVRAEMEGKSVKPERLQYLICHSPTILYSCKISINYNFTFVSENAATVLGYSAWEFLVDEHFFASRIHPQDAPRVFANLPRLFECGHHAHEYRFRHKNGQYRWIHDELKLVRDEFGNPVEMVGSWIDITDHKLSEVMLQQQTKELQEVYQLNEELWQSNSELEQFAYVASHDLQEPLRAVNSYTQLLAQKYQGNLDAKADKYIHYIVDGATRMQQLINDLLEFSRVGTQGTPLQPTNMEVVLAEVLDNLNVAITQQQAIITYDPLPWVMGDHTQLMQLLQNLLGNAIKFHREEPPQVHISAAKKGKEWVFSIRDNGIGIAPEHFERIFTIFQRLHPRREYPGTGIGLAVCKKIVERHKGRIWVESEVGSGTTFYFTLPGEK